MKKIGIITDIKGVQGGMIVSDLPDKNFNLAIGAKIHVGFSSAFLDNFTIKKWKKSPSNTAFVLLNEINKTEQVFSLLEKGIYIDENELDGMSENMIPESDSYEAYKVINEENGEYYGLVAYVISSPAHDILVVNSKSGEILIPYVDNFIGSIDDEKKSIYVKYIDGLINLNKNDENDED